LLSFLPFFCFWHIDLIGRNNFIPPPPKAVSDMRSGSRSFVYTIAVVQPVSVFLPIPEMTDSVNVVA
jgi:hypothetical protein